MLILDSHCHLDRYDDVDSILQNARNTGVGRFLSISTNPKTFARLVDIAEGNDDVYGTVGIHPCDIDALPDEAVYPWLCQGIGHPKIVGIGETGLDGLASSPPMADQERCFRHHIRAALNHGLPLIVHTRNSDEAFLSVMRDVRTHWTGGDSVMGVLHCFTGSLECAKQVIDWGWKVSLSGIVTFKNAPALHEMARALPLSALLIETDAPWLAPHPYRGQRNQPAYIIETAKMLANLRGCSVDHAVQATTENALSLFHKMSPMMPAVNGATEPTLGTRGATDPVS